MPCFYDVLYSNSYSIICVAESWLDECFSNGLIDPKGFYSIYRKDRVGSTGGGVCVLISRHLISYVIDIDYSVFNKVDIVACKVQIDNHTKLLLVCCYLAPSVENDIFLSYIECLRNMCDITGPCLLIGDRNLPNINWKANIFPASFKCQCFYSFCSDFGLSQLIDCST